MPRRRSGSLRRSRRSRSPRRRSRSPRRIRFSFGDIPEISEEELHKKFILREAQVLGRGTFGKVILALEVDTNIFRAVKIIAIRDARKERVTNELMLHSMLKHPNIVTIHYTCLGKEQAYIVMDYCPGDLIQAIVSYNLDVSIVAHILFQLCNAINYCHEQGIIHRDIKPDNILLDEKMNVKVADFGLAIKAEMSRDPVGTAKYAAPEQILGRPYDARVDNWAIGMVCYTLCNGQPMFRVIHPQRIEEQLSDQTRGDILSRLGDDKAIEFISGLTRYDPEKRTKLTVAVTHAFIRDNIVNYPKDLTYAKLTEESKEDQPDHVYDSSLEKYLQ